MSNEPVYMGRRFKLKVGLTSSILGLFAFRYSPAAGRVLLGFGLFMLIRGVVRGRERIV